MGAGVAEELSHEQSNQCRLARARWPENQAVADVADMEVQAEGRRAGGGCVAERGTRWRIVRAWMLLEPGPDARKRNQVGKVQRVK